MVPHSSSLAGVVFGVDSPASLLASALAARPLLACQSPPPSAERPPNHQLLDTRRAGDQPQKERAGGCATPPAPIADASASPPPGDGSSPVAGGSSSSADPPRAHRPRLVRKPTPLVTHPLPRDPSPHGDCSWAQSVAVLSRQEAATAAAAAAADQLAIGGSHSQAWIDDDMEIDFHAIDVDAIAAAAAKAAKAGANTDNAIDLTLESSQEEKAQSAASSHHAAGVSTHADAAAGVAVASSAASSGGMVDIEDTVVAPSSRLTAVPLSLRASPPMFSVTDFSAMNWCEKQVDLALRFGKRAPPPQAQARMDRGTAIHLAYELETIVKVYVEPESQEDIWALRLINMMHGVQELAATGRTREMPVFGCLQLPAGDGSGRTSTVWITGIIDEVVRLDLFDAEMERKRRARDAMPTIKSPKKSPKKTTSEKRRQVEAETTDAAAAVASIAAASMPAGGKPPIQPVKASTGGAAPIRVHGSAEKRKRDDAAALDSLFSPPPSLTRPASVPTPAPATSTSSASHASCTLTACHAAGDVVQLVCTVDRLGSIALILLAAALPDLPGGSESQGSLMDMDISDDDCWHLLSPDGELQRRVERVMSQEAKPASLMADPEASPPPSIRRALSLPVPPVVPAPPRVFPRSHRHVVMDHKTRASDSMPSVAQKIGTYLQISIYKLLLDRWLGSDQRQPTRSDQVEERKSAEGDREPPLHSLAEDPELPPFSLAHFFDAFRLNSSRSLGSSLQSHLAACGLSPDATLGDLFNFTLASCKQVARTYKEMKVEYEYQKDSRYIGHDTYSFDRRWLADELHHHLTYWLGLRPPAPVSLGDGFKCGRCDYADLCDDRVSKYQRVGRLVLEASPAEDEAKMTDGPTDANVDIAAPTPTEEAAPSSKRQKSETATLTSPTPAMHGSTNSIARNV